MTWENLRPKILARHDFSGCAGEASWDSFKSFIIPESPTGLAFQDHNPILAIWWASLGLAMCKISGFEASPGLAQASPCIKP